MDSQPIRDERILEALEVCRPGGDDLADPALAELAEQLSANPDLKRLYEDLQDVDARLSAAFHDVPVPEGMARRIADRLEADRAQQATMADPQTPAATTLPAGPKRVSRRRLLIAAGTFTTGAVLLVAALIYINTRDHYTKSTVLDDAATFFRNESPQGGQLLSNAPADYPISPDVREASGTRWRKISGFLGRKGVAYDLPGPGRGATLYVVKLQVSDLKSTVPPSSPGEDTHGLCTAAWQVGELLYVLVAPGSRRDYRRCLAPPGLVT